MYNVQYTVYSVQCTLYSVSAANKMRYSQYFSRVNYSFISLMIYFTSEIYLTRVDSRFTERGEREREGERGRERVDSRSTERGATERGIER